MRLLDKVCIVTGAARGIGRAIAERFVTEGARVAIVDVREAEGLETERALRSAGGAALFVRTDVSDDAQVQAMVKQVLARWGRIDMLVNDAGVCPFWGFLVIPEAL